MTEVFKLLGTIAIDASGVGTTLDDTSRRTGLFSEKVQSDFRKIAQTAATVFTLDKIKDFGMACVEQYADIAAAESAFTQVMGDYTDKATAKLQGLEAQTGVVSSRMMNHFTMMTSRFVGRGYSIEEATDLAAKGMLVAADAAAMYNMTLDESVGHLNSFLNGSYEGGEAIGLYARDTEMAQKALEKGFEWDSFEEGEKQVFRLMDAVQQMADSKVTGQSLFEAGSYQNQLANMKAMAAEASTVLGEPLMNDVVLPVITKLGELLQLVIDHKDEIKEALSPFTEFLGDSTALILDTFTGMLSWIVEHEGALTATMSAIGLAFAGVAIATHPILTALAAIIDFILWFSDEKSTKRAMEIEGATEDTHVVKTAGKYGHWTDEQKEAANDYITAVAIDDWTWRDNSAQKMIGAGLSQEDVDGFITDLETAISEGDYWVTIQETWFDEGTETNLQTELDDMNLEATVSVKPEYALQTYVNTGGKELPGVKGYATGLDRVPYDNFPAILHKDEAVLNATNAAVWRNGGGMGDTSRLEASINGLYGLLSQIITNTGRNQTVVLDSGVMVGQMLPAIDTGLGAIAARKGRRNG